MGKRFDMWECRCYSCGGHGPYDRQYECGDDVVRFVTYITSGSRGKNLTTEELIEEMRHARDIEWSKKPTQSPASSSPAPDP